MAADVPVDLSALILALVATYSAALLQGAIGFGMALATVPVLSLVDPALTPVPQLLLSFPLSAAILWRERAHLDVQGMGWVLGGRIPGVAIGLVLLASFARPQLELAIAVSVLAAVAAIASGIRIVRNPATGLLAGVASGIMGLIASIGGPPIALLYRESDGPTLRASLSAVFSIGLVISIAARAFAGEITRTDLEVSLILLPAVALGLWSSRFLAGRVEGAPLRAAVLIVSATAAMILGVRALVG